MLCRTPFQKLSNHLEPTKPACRNWYCLLIANEGMQSHLEGSPNFIAWTYKKGRWQIKDKATGIMRHRRREKLKDVTFFVRHIFLEKETIGWETRTGFIFHPLHSHFCWKSKSFSPHICQYPKGGTQMPIKKNPFWKRNFQKTRLIRVGITGVLEISTAKTTYKRSA